MTPTLLSLSFADLRRLRERMEIECFRQRAGTVGERADQGGVALWWKAQIQAVCLWRRVLEAGEEDHDCSWSLMVGLQKKSGARRASFPLCAASFLHGEGFRKAGRSQMRRTACGIVVSYKGSRSNRSRYCRPGWVGVAQTGSISRRRLHSWDCWRR